MVLFLFLRGHLTDSQLFVFVNVFVFVANGVVVVREFQKFS